MNLSLFTQLAIATSLGILVTSCTEHRTTQLDPPSQEQNQNPHEQNQNPHEQNQNPHEQNQNPHEQNQNPQDPPTESLKPTRGNIYENAISEDKKNRAGIIGDINLFPPEKPITVWLQTPEDSAHLSETAAITYTSDNGESGAAVLTPAADSSILYGVFTPMQNGIYTVSVKTRNDAPLTFDIGVIDPNPRADDRFWYGIQPYISRVLYWGEGQYVAGQDAVTSVATILKTAQYMGVNLIREDVISWGAMQTGPQAPIDLTLQKKAIQLAESFDLRYDLILGGNAGEWSVNSNYKDKFDPKLGWSYCPDETMWDAFVTDLANQFASDNNIIWEIWNEPNWGFFTGTQDEYASLLERTASILKKANSNAYITSGGLANPYLETNKFYYTKAAELIKQGLLNAWAYHNHDPFPMYYETARITQVLAKECGLEHIAGLNSESGVSGSDPGTIASKLLHTRALGDRGFVSFSFRQTPTPSSDISDYAFFSPYLQPNAAAIAYMTTIRFTGNAEFVKSISNTPEKCIDLYLQNDHSILAIYNFTGTSTVNLPSSNYKIYDINGNLTTVKSNSVTVTSKPLYVVYDSMITPEEFATE